MKKPREDLRKQLGKFSGSSLSVTGDPDKPSYDPTDFEKKLDQIANLLKWTGLTQREKDFLISIYPQAAEKGRLSKGQNIWLSAIQKRFKESTAPQNPQ